MSKQLSQETSYETKAVAQENRQSWVKVFASWLGLLFSVPTVIYGVIVGTNLSLEWGLLAILLGCSVLAFFTTKVSHIGADTGLTSYELYKFFMGKSGGVALAAVLTLVMLGWQGMGTIVVIEALAVYFPALGSGAGFVLCGTALNLLFMFTVWTSFKGLNILSRIAMPIIVVFLLIALVQTERVYGINTLFGQDPVNPQNFIYVVFSVASVWLNVPLRGPDFSRFSRSKKDTMIATILAFSAGATLIYGIGAIAGNATGMDSVSAIYASLNIGVLALPLIVLLSWTSCSSGIYSGSLALATILPIKSKQILLLICIAIISVFTFINLNAYFMPFVDLTGMTFAPVLALFLTDYKFFRDKYKMNPKDIKPHVSWSALLALAIGMLSNRLGGDYGVVISLVVTPIVYYILNKYVLPDKLLAAYKQMENVQEPMEEKQA